MLFDLINYFKQNKGLLHNNYKSNQLQIQILQH